jgi:hypothetical protein
VLSFVPQGLNRSLATRILLKALDDAGATKVAEELKLFLRDDPSFAGKAHGKDTENQLALDKDW